VVSALRAAEQRILAERLVLEPLLVGHADELVLVLRDPELHRFVGGEPLGVDALRERFALLVRGHSADGGEEWFNWVVREAGGVAVGTVQATVTRGGRTAEVAWVIGTAWQGRGYAGEAARALVGWLVAGGVLEVVAHVHPDHVASEGVARRAGLVPTETFLDGERRWRLQVAGNPEASSRDSRA
jgi:RimJ/RimL family protein N-acetyltransferase